MEAALRELKCMAAQLDESRVEIAALKAAGAGAVVNGGTRALGSSSRQEVTSTRVTRSSAGVSASSSSSSGPQRIKNDNNNAYCR